MSESAPAESRQRLSKLFLHLELLLVVAIWAGTFVSTKIVLTELPPALSALYRYVIASAILIVIDWGNTKRPARKDYPLLAFLGATGVTLYYLLQHYGIRYTNATDAAILISLSPIFIGIISWQLLGEKLKAAGITGLILSFVGCLLVITGGHPTAVSFDERFLGNVLILLTAIAWAFYSVYGKKLLRFYSTTTIIKYTTVSGTIFLIPFTIGEFDGHSIFTVSWNVFFHLLYLGGLASVYGYLAWYRGLSKLPAVTVGSYLYFRPLLTGFIAALVLQEQISLAVILGGVLIIAGTYLTTK